VEIDLRVYRDNPLVGTSPQCQHLLSRFRMANHSVVPTSNPIFLCPFSIISNPIVLNILQIHFWDHVCTAYTDNNTIKTLLPVIVVRSRRNQKLGRRWAHLDRQHLLGTDHQFEEAIPIPPSDGSFLVGCHARCEHKLVSEGESVLSIFCH